jgi:SAM-dependent methyltransferase
MIQQASAARYETIGVGYARTRRADPRIAARVWQALGAARSVVNVGAGSGNYEPTDRRVIAVEPAAAMIAQRSAQMGPAVRAVAEALPFPGQSFDAALATFTLHHWRDLAAGLAELRRVARRQVILMNEPEIGWQFWLAQYFPEAATLPTERSAPAVALVQQHLEVREVIPIPIPADCSDGFVGAYWSRPEAYLDPAVIAGMSTLALLPPADLARGMARLQQDLASGVWDAQFGHLRRLPDYDLGYRLLVAG